MQIIEFAIDAEDFRIVGHPESHHKPGSMSVKGKYYGVDVVFWEEMRLNE